jgi:response regulator NasT
VATSAGKGTGEPFTGGETPVDPAPILERGLPESPQRILIADDEHLVAQGIVSQLQELGYDVVGPANDGDGAVELCRTSAPDMALLDIRMPRKDGIAAAQEIYESMVIPVVLFSAYSDDEYVAKAAETGIYGYLLKPVTTDHLRITISLAWRRFVDRVDQIKEIGGLKQRLEDRKLIEQAKWILVKGKGIDEPAAMRLLQRQARDNRRKLVDVARSVIENEALISDT